MTSGENGFLKNGGNLAQSNGEYVDWVIHNGEIKFGQGHAYLANHADEISNAGQAIIKDGKIIKISNGSGHYTPSPENLDEAIDIFKSLEVVSDKLSKTVYYPKK